MLIGLSACSLQDQRKPDRGTEMGKNPPRDVLVERGTVLKNTEHNRDDRLSYLPHCTEKQHEITGSQIEEDKSE